MIWWLTASGFTTLGLLLVLGRRNERAVRRDWHLLLGPRAEKVLERVESRTRDELELADLTYDGAFQVRQLGSMDEAIELLEVGYRIIETFAPGMLRLLAAMTAFSRMVSAMAPVPPLRPRAFRLAQIVSLAYLNRLLHQFAVSTAERFRLRAFILGQGFGLASRFLLRSTRRIAERTPDADREWEQIQAIRHDFRALTDESMESLRVLLTSLAADRREDALKGLT